jgi:hypothetical protein
VSNHFRREAKLVPGNLRASPHLRRPYAWHADVAIGKHSNRR